VDKYKDRDWMYEHYVVLQESSTVMAKIAGCGRITILNWLHRFDIPVRSSFEANRNYLNISQELLDLLEGELLGDGCIQMHSQRSARYNHGSKYKEYVEWLSMIFADLGLEQSGKINKYWDEKYSTFGYFYQSRSYPELVPLRQRFYPKGEKIVPKDLILTPIMVRQWLIGDGCLHNHAKKRPYIDFNTQDFDKASINRLLQKLGAKDLDFLKWIGPCPKEIENIYGYKWDYQDNRKKV